MGRRREGRQNPREEDTNEFLSWTRNKKQISTQRENNSTSNESKEHPNPTRQSMIINNNNNHEHKQTKHRK